MARRNLDRPARCVLGGRLVLTLWLHSSGSVWEPKPALAQLTPAQKEECAAWLADRHIPRLTHDEAYARLFGR